MTIYPDGIKKKGIRTPINAAQSAGVTPQPEIFTLDFNGKDGDWFLNGGSGATGRSMLFYSSDTTSNYPWFNVNNGDNSDPSSGNNGIEINSLGALDTDTQAAQSYADAVTGDGKYTCVRSGKIVTCTAVDNGSKINAVDVDFGITPITTQQGAP